jgi:hypothetical protein
MSAVLLVSLALSWLASEIARAQAQRSAIEAIREFGGDTKYDYEYTGSWKFVTAHPKPRGPAWLRNLLGGDFFDDVVFADLRISETCVIPGDEAVKHIAKLPALQELDLSFTEVTDAGLRHISKLDRLQRLELAYTDVSDAGVEHLRSLGGLKDLWITRTKITEEGVEQLQEALPECEIAY